MWLKSLLCLSVLTMVAIAAPRIKQKRPRGRDTRYTQREVEAMAAKTTIWTGAVNDSWETGGNWSNGQPAYIASPGPYDTVLHSTTATNAMGSNLDRSGDGAGAGLHLELFQVHEDVLDDIGASETLLKLTAEKIIHSGRGFLYYEAKTGTDAERTERLVINGDGGSVIATNADIAAIELVGGNNQVTIGGADTVGQLIIGPQVSNTPLVVDVDGAVGSTIDNFWMSGGTADLDADGPLATSLGGFLLSGGVLTLSGATLLPTGGTTLQAGGTLINKSSATQSGTYLINGRFDCTQSVVERTLAKIWVWPNADLLLDDLTTATITRIGE